MKKLGKKAVYVNSNIYSQNINKDNFTKASIAAEIPDAIRYYSSNFWTLKNNELVKATISPLFTVNHISDDVYVLTADKTKFYEDTFQNGLLKKEFNKKAWETFLLEKLPPENEVFEDYYTIFPEPVNIAETPDHIEKGISYINKEFVFNFLSQKFENLVNDQLFNVNTLPTIFNILEDPSVDFKTSNENLFLSLGGFISDNYVQSLLTSKSVNTLLKSYFDVYADTYTLPEVAPVVRELKKFENNIFSKSKQALIKKINNKFIPFPFYSQIEFTNLSSDQNSFVHILENLGNLDEELLFFLQDQYTLLEKNFVYSSPEGSASEVLLPFYDLKNWINSALAQNAASDNVLSSEIAIKYTKLLQYIKDNLKTKSRNYQNLLNESHLEVLFYKIEKRQFNNNKENKPIQTYYLFADKSDVIKYIDTQLKYGIDYYYNVTAYTTLVGTEYSYGDYYGDSRNAERMRDLENGLYKISVKTRAAYKIFEIPMAKFYGAVHQKPFTKPVMSVNQQNDKILFNILDSDLNNYEKFEVIENNDFKIFEDIRISQDNEDPETIQSIINSSSDSILQIYRTTTFPVNFLSFQGKLYKTIVLDKNAKSFIDTLTPNIKYYYAFRLLNDHSVPSNVSAIHEIKLVDEDGYYYIENRIIDLKSPFPKKSYKGMKRYLLIRPSTLQVQPQYDKNVETIHDINLGPAGENVWEKPFTITIKSSKTNRKLKFNFKTRIDRKNN